ncbi:MAG: NusG domain II-containing protein [Treponema sp.]|nr:NusG domain II-containing protein [Treponema sp.]
MKRKLPVTIPDIAIILLFAALIVFSGAAVLTGTRDAARVVIQGPNDRTWIFPLEDERTVRVRGILGDDTVVRISGGAVWAESSPCTNQICVNMGRISAGSLFPMVSCLPNHVMFRIEGNNERADVDRTTW